MTVSERLEIAAKFYYQYWQCTSVDLRKGITDCYICTDGIRCRLVIASYNPCQDETVFKFYIRRGKQFSYHYKGDKMNQEPGQRWLKLDRLNEIYSEQSIALEKTRQLLVAEIAAFKEKMIILDKMSALATFNQAVKSNFNVTRTKKV